MMVSTTVVDGYWTIPAMIIGAFVVAGIAIWWMQKHEVSHGTV